MLKALENSIKKPLNLYLILVAVPLLLYCRSFYADFSPLDEQWMILQNKELYKGWSNIGDVISKPVLNMYYRPVLMLTVMFDYNMSELNPLAYHISNVLFHIACVLLLFNFVKQITSQRTLAFVIALLFAVHPINVHAVSWIPGRNDTLLCLFTLAALNSLLLWIREKKIIALIFHFVFFLLAMFTKENGLLLVLLFAPLFFITSIKEQFENDKERMEKLGLMLFIWIALAACWFFLRKSIIDQFPVPGADLLKNIKDFFSGLILFTGKAIVPIQQSVFPTLTDSSLLPGIFVVLILATLPTVLGFKNKSLALYGLFFFLVMISVPLWSSAVGSNHEHLEHRMYTALVGLLLFLSQLNWEKAGKAMHYALVSILILFSVKTFAREKVYKDDILFSEDGIETSPHYYLFYYRMGDMAIHFKDYQKALLYLNKSIELRTGEKKLFFMRANCNFELKNYKAAADDYTKAISFGSFVPEYVVNRCITYYNLHEYEKALKDIFILRAQSPQNEPKGLEAKINLEWDLQKLEQVNKRVAAAPNDPLLYNERGLLEYSLQKYQEALADFKKAKDLDPKDASISRNYAQMLELLKQQ